MADTTYIPKTYRKDGGDTHVIASGGVLDVESGGALKLAGVAITPTAAELNEQVLTMDIATGSGSTDFYVVAPHAGDITKIYTVIDAAITDADITVTASIGEAAVTDGAVTIAYSESAAGNIDIASPSAANTITAGAAIKLVVAGGTTAGGDRVHIAIVITR